MLCYVLVIVVKKLHIRIDNNKKFVKFIVLGIVLVMAFAYLSIRLNDIFIFFVGYSLAQCDFKESKKNLLILTFSMALGMSIRLIGNQYFDGTVFYDFIIAGFTHDMLAIWIFYTIKTVYKFLDNHQVIYNIVTQIEGLSYYIYITHYTFLNGIMCVDQISSSIPLQLISFLILTYISAKLLKYIEQRLLIVFA